MLLPAEPVLAGTVGKGKGDPAAREHVLALVSVYHLFLSSWIHCQWSLTVYGLHTNAEIRQS